MKRIVIGAVCAAALSLSCADLFDNNLYATVDKPAPLSASALSSKTQADIVAMMGDSSFYVQLQADPASLDAAQSVLATGFNSAALTAATTSDKKAAVVTAAQEYIAVTANGSAAGAVVTDAILQASKLTSGTAGDGTAAVKGLVAGKSQADIVTILTNLTEIGGALTAMQTASTSGSAVDANLFFGSTDNKGDLAQTALVAAAVTALVSDATGASTTAKIADLAAKLAAGTAPTTGSATTDFQNALKGTTNPASNNYAYLSAVTSVIKL